MSNQEQFNRRSRMAAMQEMASALSFDLTDMVTVLQHKMGNIKREVESKKSSSNEMEKIESVLSRMARIAKGMRSLGLMGDEETLETISLDKLIQPTITLATPWFESKGIDFEVEEIPEVKLRCKPTQISQSIVNLLNNAIDATQKLPNKSVTLGFKLVGKSPVRLQIIVSDSGTLSAEVGEQMFEPFFSTKQQGQGMGLGLNIAKSVAEAHSGKIFWDRAVLHTRIIFEIPTSLETKVPT